MNHKNPDVIIGQLRIVVCVRPGRAPLVVYTPPTAVPKNNVHPLRRGNGTRPIKAAKIADPTTNLALRLFQHDPRITTLHSLLFIINNAPRSFGLRNRT